MLEFSRFSTNKYSNSQKLRTKGHFTPAQNVCAATSTTQPTQKGGGLKWIIVGNSFRHSAQEQNIIFAGSGRKKEEVVDFDRRYPNYSLTREREARAKTTPGRSRQT